MVNITLNKNIIHKHMQFLYNSPIFDRLDLLLHIDVCNELKFKYTSEFIEQHVKFIKYLQTEIVNLNNNNVNYDKNIFLAKPDELQNIIYAVNELFPEIHHTLQNNEKISSKLDKTYSEIIFDAIGYDEFTNIDILRPLAYEIKKIKIINKTYIMKLINNMIVIQPKRITLDVANKVINYIVKEILKIVSKEHIAFFLVNDSINELHKLSNRIISKEKLVIDIRDTLRKLTGQMEKLSNDLFSTDYINIYSYKQIQNLIGNNWGAYDFLMDLGIKICPYCNQNFISPIYSQNGKVRADLDHFFSKAKYPYLSMSIYNLVPSCKFCNSSLKGTYEFTYETNFNPYDSLIVEELFNFTYIPYNYESFYKRDDFKLVINYNTSKKNYKKILNNNNRFNIENLYQYHKDIVRRLILKRFIYDDSYIKYLNQNYKDLFNSPDDIKNLLLNSYDTSDIKNSSLGKLINDIINELDFNY